MKKTLAFTVIALGFGLAPWVAHQAILYAQARVPGPGGSGASSCVDPNSSPHLRAWMEQDCISHSPCGSPADNTTVTNWWEQVNGVDATNVGTEVYHTNVNNSRGGVTFNGTGGFKVNSDLSGVTGGGHTVMAVFKTTATGSGQTFWGGSTGTFNPSLIHTSGTTRLLNIDKQAVSNVGFGTHVADTNFHTVLWAYRNNSNTAAINIRIDGADDSPTLAGSVDMSDGWTGPYELGCGGSLGACNSSFSFQGTLQFVAYWSFYFTSADWTCQESLLRAKYATW